MHTMLILLLVAAAGQPASVAGSTLGYVGARRSLWKAWQLDGVLGQATMVNNQSDARIDSSGIIGNIQHRQLQHNPGKHKKQHLSVCHVCTFNGCNAYHTHREGHCKANMQLFSCAKPKSGGQVYIGSNWGPSAAFPIKSRAKSTPSKQEERLVVIQVPASNTSTVVVGVGCFSDADCQLSLKALVPRKGRKLVSQRGVVTGECVGLVRDVDQPGMCFCPFREQIVVGGRPVFSAENARPRNPLRRMQEDVSQAPQSRKRFVPQYDICVRQSSLVEPRIVIDPTGHPRLANSTANRPRTNAFRSIDNELLLDNELVELELDVPDDYVYMEDAVSDGFTILASATEFSREDLVGSEDYVSAPNLPTLQRAPTLQRPAPERNPDQRADNAPASAPGSDPIPRRRDTAPAPAPAPAPRTVATSMRGNAGGANRRTVISEEIDISLRYYQDV